jgi:rubrerythrin
MQNQESIVRTKEKNKVKYVCKLCDYITFRKSNIERHFKTIKHKEQKGAKKEQKRSKKEQKGATENEYCCSVCNYQTIYKANLQRHIENLSHHEKVIKSDKKVIKNDKQNQEKKSIFL